MLHDRLYAGRLRVHLRSDIPFVPHITVGTFRDSQTAARLASEFGSRARVVRGTISNLHLIDVETLSVRNVNTYLLGNAPKASA